MTTNAHAADHRSQANTLPVATSWNAHWTLDELNFVAAFESERDEDIALALNRTLYAIRAIRTVLEERREKAQARRAERRPELTITSWDEWERSFD